MAVRCARRYRKRRRTTKSTQTTEEKLQHGKIIVWRRRTRTEKKRKQKRGKIGTTWRKDVLEGRGQERERRKALKATEEEA